MHAIEVNRNFSRALCSVACYSIVQTYREKILNMKRWGLMSMAVSFYFSSSRKTIFTLWFAAAAVTAPTANSIRIVQTAIALPMEEALPLQQWLIQNFMRYWFHVACVTYKCFISSPVCFAHSFLSLEFVDFLPNGYQLICITRRTEKNWIKQNQSNERSCTGKREGGSEGGSTL